MDNNDSQNGSGFKIRIDGCPTCQYAIHDPQINIIGCYQLLIGKVCVIEEED